MESGEQQRILQCVREQVMFPGLCRVLDVSPSPSSVVIGVSNEPTGGWWETPDRRVFVSGYCNDTESLERSPVDLELARVVNRTSGRFSALTIDRARGRFALATSAARVDSVFRAENDDFIYFGNQASMLSVLRDGRVRFAPERLMTLLDAGFFGNDATPYDGVDAVESLSTIVVDEAGVRKRTHGLWTLKNAEYHERSLRRAIAVRLNPMREFSAFEQGFQDLANHLAGAFAPLASEPKVQLALTGGMDSRLLLASALAAGVQVECFTNRYGQANRADVNLAKHVAGVVGVKHRVQDRSHPNRSGAQDKPLDILAATKRTLAATDGMLSARYPVASIKPHTGTRHVSGQGGEILRGGYGEKEWRPPAMVLRKRWNHLPKLYRPEVLQRHEAEVAMRLSKYPSLLSAGDILDCFYVDLRCGRWAAAATSASTSRIRPLLDNAVVNDALAIPTRVKRLHVLHKRVIELLCPSLERIPLANKYWHGTGPLERHLIAKKWPHAFAAAPSRPRGKRRTVQPETEALIRRYVIEEDRLSLLGDLVQVDELRSYLGKAPTNYQLYDHLLLGLYSVSVLLSENWRQVAARQS